MKIRLSSNTILNYLLWLTLILQDAGTFGFLPLNIFQILELIMFLIICFSYKKLNISRTLLFLFIYIGVVTIVNPFDFDSIKSFVFFGISLFMIYFYLERNSLRIVAKIVYSAAVILAIYGVIQEFAYVLHIPAIYDISRYGFALNGSYAMPNGLMRAMSLYAEPSHVSAIMGIGLLIGLVGKNEQIEGVKSWKTIIICIFSFFTQSTVVYLTIIIAIVCFIFFYQGGWSRKIKWVLIGSLVTLLIFVVQKDMLFRVLGRLSQFRNLQTDTGNDLSAVAIISNLKIAIEKMKDGFFIGTGLDSHRLYYDRYIGKIYTNLYLYLNTDDCASLYVRIFSEFGIFGILFFLATLIIKLVKGIKVRDKYIVIAVLMFGVAVMRNGSYMETLTQILFIWIFFVKDVEKGEERRR